MCLDIFWSVQVNSSGIFRIVSNTGLLDLYKRKFLNISFIKMIYYAFHFFNTFISSVRFRWFSGDIYSVEINQFKYSPFAAAIQWPQNSSAVLTNWNLFLSSLANTHDFMFIWVCFSIPIIIDTIRSSNSRLQISLDAYFFICDVCWIINGRSRRLDIYKKIKIEENIRHVCVRCSFVHQRKLLRIRKFSLRTREIFLNSFVYRDIHSAKIVQNNLTC